MRWVALLLLVPLAGCVTNEADVPVGLPDRAGLTFLDPVDLLCPDQPNYPRDCGGFGEPQLEVAGDGTIWYSAVCCVGQSPPIWRSFDGGQTFEILPFADGTGASRDAFGIEGDFAIDDAGNVFFFDISAATAYITKFEADGTHVHTKADPFPPLVDRPWIRAGEEDQVFILYNTATSSRFYRSDDGGLTWDLAGGREFPCALMALGQGPVRDHLIVGGCAGQPSAWQSFDGGRTWGERIVLPDVPGRATEQYMQPMADAAGITYVPVTHEDGDQTRISVYAIHPEGVRGPFAATDNDGFTDKPWLIAGQQGIVAMAHYEADDVADQDDATWHLKITYSLNADTMDPVWTTVVADPDPVHQGVFGRSLGDFLQLRQTETGDLVVAYAAREGDTLTNKFVRSQGMDFGPAVFRNGPQT